MVGGRLVVGNLLLLLDLLLCQFLLFEVFLFDGCKSNEYAFSLDHQQSNSEDSVLVCHMLPPAPRYLPLDSSNPAVPVTFLLISPCLLKFKDVHFVMDVVVRETSSSSHQQFACV